MTTEELSNTITYFDFDVGKELKITKEYNLDEAEWDVEMELDSSAVQNAISGRGLSYSVNAKHGYNMVEGIRKEDYCVVKWVFWKDA